jgi:hypothetical protein
MKVSWGAIAATAAILTLAWTVLTAIISLPSWRQSSTLADWPGNDVACSRGSLPAAERCDAGSVGMVAVCWDGGTYCNPQTPKGCEGYESILHL